MISRQHSIHLILSMPVTLEKRQLIACTWAARSFTGPHPATSSWYVSFVEGIYLGRKYFKGTVSHGPLTDDELRGITSSAFVLVGKYEHIYNPSAAVAHAVSFLVWWVWTSLLTLDIR